MLIYDYFIPKEEMVIIIGEGKCEVIYDEHGVTFSPNRKLSLYLTPGSAFLGIDYLSKKITPFINSKETIIDFDGCLIKCKDTNAKNIFKKVVDEWLIFYDDYIDIISKYKNGDIDFDEMRKYRLKRFKI